VIKLWIEIIVLFSIVLMVISIMVVLIVETLHTTKSISKKRNKRELDKESFNYTNIYR
jgi:competence protein ComGC